MKIAVTQWTITQIFLGLVALNALRYAFFAGGAFLLFWGLLAGRLSHRRIQRQPIRTSQVFREAGYSLLTILILGLTGTFLVWYQRIKGPTLFGDGSQVASWILWVSIPALVLLHDTYFYFAHRLMHHPKLYRMTHVIHHRSLQPTPLAAFTFQPAEAFLQALFVVIVVLLYPVPIASLAVFLFYSLIMNIMGHLGYEILPAGFTRSPWTWWSNTATHHALHHRYVNCNYSLYFNWWDRILGTNHERYHEAFEAVVSGEGLEGHR